jgi:hypothetical protein
MRKIVYHLISVRGRSLILEKADRHSGSYPDDDGSEENKK